MAYPFAIDKDLEVVENFLLGNTDLTEECKSVAKRSKNTELLNSIYERCDQFEEHEEGRAIVCFALMNKHISVVCLMDASDSSVYCISVANNISTPTMILIDFLSRFDVLRASAYETLEAQEKANAWIQNPKVD